MDRLLADIVPSGFSTSWIVPIFAVVFVIYLTMRPKRRDPLASQQPFRTSLVQQRALERDMQNVIVELSEMTRQMTAQVETRATKLEQLMREADAKIAELKQISETVASMQATIASADNFTQIASDTIRSEELSEESSRDSTRPAMRLVSDANPHTEDRWAEVYRLGDEGLTLPEIARRLARPNGEVELILALRPKPEAIAHPSDVQVGHSVAAASHA